VTASTQAGPSPIPVVIVGAGPVGVTAATLLGQYGVRCLVLDRWDGVYPQPRAVVVDDEVVRILERMGVAEEFAAVSRPTAGLRLVDRHHRLLVEFDRAGEAGRHGHPRANMFDQPELEHLLRANLKGQTTVDLRGNVEVTEVSQDDRGRVRVDFTDRISGEHDSVLADYVLGCDGANSVVRSSIGTTMQDLGFEQRWLVVDVTTDADLGQWDGAHQVCDPDRAATYMRIGETRYRWEFQLLPSETAADYDSLETLRPLMQPWVERVPDEGLTLVRVAEYTFRAQVADRWRDRHVFLLGDAAHLTPPFIGQGLCAGLRDSMNLSWKLAAVLRGELPEAALDTYQAERKPHARALIKLAKLVGAAMTRGGRTGDLLRRVLMPRWDRVPGLRTRLLDSETPPLTRGPLVVGPRRSLAGRLCPNALLSDGRRLDEVAMGRFVLVSAVPVSQGQRQRLGQREVTVVEATPGAPLHAWLTTANATAALVRPDHTVMRAGRDLAALVEAAPARSLG
jgi:3-(3-hydroxy-phenyl)propionate hydroxylase